MTMKVRSIILLALGYLNFFTYTKLAEFFTILCKSTFKIESSRLILYNYIYYYYYYCNNRSLKLKFILKRLTFTAFS